MTQQQQQQEDLQGLLKVLIRVLISKRELLLEIQFNQRALGIANLDLATRELQLLLNIISNAD